MTNNSDKIGCSGKFHVVFKHLQYLENLILTILKEILNISCLASSFFFLKLYKALRTAQCKQPRLIKPLLNFDVNFTFKSSGTNLLETIVSC